MNMNISTGGPHILFFERDASLMALLISEFQLAGYECHTARTAVEVFDAIARHPIRVLLVDMAQAAAGRREFWVALDTQRRGRGVQVFTYQCYNLAGYGPREVDERSSPVAVDLEIDGMLGLMNLVERIRERIPAISQPTGPVPRFTRSTTPLTPASSYSSPSSSASPSGTNANGTPYRNGSNGQEYVSGNAGASQQPAAQISSTLTTPGGGLQSNSEKIRAVLYSSPPIAPASSPTQEPYNASNATNTTIGTQQAASVVDASFLQQLAYGQPARESSLSQLSRMVQEYHPLATPEETDTTFARQTTGSIGSQPLRASPIEDLPLERANNNSTIDDAGRHDDTGTYHSGIATQPGQNGYSSYLQEGGATVPLASITTPMKVVQTPQGARLSPTQTQPLASVSSPVVPARPTVPIAAVSATTLIPVGTPSASGSSVQERQERVQTVEGDQASVRQDSDATQTVQSSEVQEVGNVQETDVLTEDTEDRAIVKEERAHVEEDSEDAHEHRAREDATSVTQQEMALADILQSLPASSVSSQPQVFNGQPTRSLGSVLLEGHLVQQSRLEVAQNIQRMLRGVDLRYELGEILLMFKLLTPDQLLAATLVSNGLISTQQISALGRIRQELHSIGLEYDLESLLILFRMLTPEQLREARSSWQS